MQGIFEQKYPLPVLPQGYCVPRGHEYDVPAILIVPAEETEQWLPLQFMPVNVNIVPEALTERSPFEAPALPVLILPLMVIEPARVLPL
jgi:hypothetical protein